METDVKSVIIDSDAHVVESAHSWDYMDPSEKQYRPIRAFSLWIMKISSMNIDFIGMPR
jgi:hypothetical protein